MRRDVGSGEAWMGRACSFVAAALLVLTASCNAYSGRAQARSSPAALVGADAEPAKAGGSISGRIVFSDEQDVYMIRADGSHLRKLTRGAATGIDPDLHGRFIAYRVETPRGAEIYRMRADGSHRRRLRRGLSPAWSPNGRWIAFADAHGSLSVMRADGSHARVIPNTDQGEYPSWSPDGERIVFNSFMQGDKDIYVVDLDGSGLQKLTDNPGEVSLPEWSPDGEDIVYQCHENDATGTRSLCAMSPTGQNQRDLLIKDGDVATWSPSGRHLVVGGSSTLTIYAWGEPIPMGHRVASVDLALFPDWEK